jgi:hypothetical protein
MSGAISPLPNTPLWRGAELKEAQRKLYLYFYLYASSSIVRMIKSRRIRWAGHAARMREMRNAYKM